MQTRRAKGSGSVRKRGSAWQIRYLAPPDKDDNRKYVSETVQGLRKDADRILRQRTGSVENGLYLEKTQETLQQYLQFWLATYSAHNTSLRTHQGYNPR